MVDWLICDESVDMIDRYIELEAFIVGSMDNKMLCDCGS